MTPTYGSLFSGIGGLDLGLDRAGMECAWQVEIDPFCRKVLEKHWPDVPKYGDIKELSGDELERVDLICGGFPCQPVSSSGRRKGRDDERWLWPEFARIVRLLRPRLVLVENVAGLLYRTGGMGEVLGDLAESGYDAEWESLPAGAFGAPYLRDRVFIVAGTDGLRRDSSATDEPPSQRHKVWGRQFPVGDGSDGNVAHANGGRHQRAGLSEVGGQHQSVFGRSGGDSRGPAIPESENWRSEPSVVRVVSGVPSPLDRCRVAALGNAVVPQVAEFVGRRIMENK